jgi:hypothetical protein
MARPNTRDAQVKLRLFTSQGNIFPGGNLVPYFAAPPTSLSGTPLTSEKIVASVKQRSTLS